MYAQPYAPPYPVTGRDGFAIAGFALSLVGAVMVAPVFCILALSRVRSSREKGRNLAIAGLVISAVWLAGAIGLAVFDELSSADRDGNGQIVGGGTLDIRDVVPGDCLAELPGDTSTSVRAVPCTGPHEVEVFDAFALPDSAWPGTEAVTEAADVGCHTRLPDDLHTRVDGGELEVTFFYPLQDTWESGNRETICLVAPAGSGAPELVA